MSDWKGDKITSFSPGEIEDDRIIVKSYAKFAQILAYCEPHLDEMWAARVASIILDCDFRDVRERIKEIQEENRPKKIESTFEPWMNIVRKSMRDEK